MRSSDCDILIVPGLGGSDPEHWQSRWQARLSTASRVEQADWDHPDPQDWVRRLVVGVERATRPVVLVAHSLGVVATVVAAPSLPPGVVRGAVLVALPDVEDAVATPPEVHPFAPLPHDPLPFPALLVASRNDPFCSYERADEMAHAWGAALVDAGESGHLNSESGFGPWPEGLMRFAGFLKGLGD